MPSSRMVVPSLVCSIACACNQPQPTPIVREATDTNTKPTATEPPPPPPVASSAPPAPSSFPALLTDCTTAADCVWYSMGPDCCTRPACEPTLGNKTWQASVERYCATKDPKCPPMACSWGSPTPKCVAGKCTDK